MKIYLAFFQGNPNHPISAYSFWPYYIKNGIQESGHLWTESADIDWAYGIVPQSKESFINWKTNTWEKAVALIKQDKPDIFLSYLYPEQIDESAIREIRTMGIPCVNFFCDNVREFTSAPKEFGVFDLNWVPEYKALRFYKKANFSYLNLPMPMWVDPKHREISKSEKDEVSFIGSKDIQRLLFFEELAKKNVNLNIYGAGWKESTQIVKNEIQQSSPTAKIKNQFDFINKHGLAAYYRKISQRNLDLRPSTTLVKHLKGKPDFEHYIKISKESAVTLGINRYPSFNYPLNNPNTYSRLRDIEAPMLGACYLTEYTEGLEDFYEIGKDIEAYRTTEGFIEKIDELIVDKSKRTQLRTNGQLKALNNHSIPHSIELIRKNLCL